MTETLETVGIRPKRNGIAVKLVCLWWIWPQRIGRFSGII